MHSKWLNLLFFLLCFYLIGSAQSVSQYRIASKIPLPGNEGWDYLTIDENTNHLFISHGSMVQVLDLKSNKVIATIKDTKGVHGITLAEDLGKGYISNGKDSSVTVFDLATFKTLGKVAVTGKNPDAILYDPFSHKVFVFNGRSSNASVIDANTDKVIATIALAGKPEFSATDSSGKIYVNIEDKSLLTVINTTDLKVENSYAIAPGKEPSGLALDNANHRLFMVCDNDLMVIMDAETGAVISSVKIGAGADGVSYDAVSKRAFSSNGEGTITVVEETGGNYKAVETIRTAKGARTIAVNSKTHHLYLPCSDFGPEPAATAENPKPRHAIKEDSFVIIDVAPVTK